MQGYLVDLNLKIAFPCANIIIVIFGAALASHVKKSGAAMGFALSIGICFSYWGMLRVSQAFGHSDILSPQLAAWGPNLIFGVVALLLIIRAPKSMRNNSSAECGTNQMRNTECGVRNERHLIIGP